MSHSKPDAVGGHYGFNHGLSWGLGVWETSPRGKRWAKKFNRREARREARHALQTALAEYEIELYESTAYEWEPEPESHYDYLFGYDERCYLDEDEDYAPYYDYETFEALPYEGFSWWDFSTKDYHNLSVYNREQTILALAKGFASKLLEALGAETIAKINSKNLIEGLDSPVCHSHDFLDANEIMGRAFEVQIGEFDLENAAHSDLWNSAWALAKNERFFQ